MEVPALPGKRRDSTQKCREKCGKYAISAGVAATAAAAAAADDDDDDYEDEDDNDDD